MKYLSEFLGYTPSFCFNSNYPPIECAIETDQDIKYLYLNLFKINQWTYRTFLEKIILLVEDSQIFPEEYEKIVNQEYVIRTAILKESVSTLSAIAFLQSDIVMSNPVTSTIATLIMIYLPVRFINRTKKIQQF